MSNGLTALTGTIPVIVMGGVAMKMTEGMFGRQRAQPTRRRRATRRRVRRAPSTSFGNFSNLGKVGGSQ